MAIITLNNRAINRSDTATSGQVFTATSATAADFQDSAAGGKVLQVQTVFKSDTFSATSSSFTDVTGMSVSITPSASNSKILIISNVGAYGGDYFSMALSRGDTLIGIGDDLGGSRISAGTGFRMANANSGHGGSILMHMDSPSTTSSTTYKLKVYTDYGTTYIGRTSSNGDTDGYYSGSCSIQAMEIGA